MLLICGDTYRLYYRVIIQVLYVWLEGLKSGKIENGEGIVNCEDRRNLIFSLICLVWIMKNGEMENKVGINFQLYPY